MYRTVADMIIIDTERRMSILWKIKRKTSKGLVSFTSSTTHNLMLVASNYSRLFAPIYLQELQRGYVCNGRSLTIVPLACQFVLVAVEKEKT